MKPHTNYYLKIHCWGHIYTTIYGWSFAKSSKSPGRAPRWLRSRVHAVYIGVWCSCHYRHNQPLLLCSAAITCRDTRFIANIHSATINSSATTTNSTRERSDPFGQNMRATPATCVNISLQLYNIILY